MKCYNYYFTPKDMDGLKICDVFIIVFSFLLWSTWKDSFSLYIYMREREREAKVNWEVDRFYLATFAHTINFKEVGCSINLKYL